MRKEKKQYSPAYRALAVLLSAMILLLSLGMGATAGSKEANIIYSNGYKIEKITNPTTGQGETDGIIQGGDRNNCYKKTKDEVQRCFKLIEAMRVMLLVHHNPSHSV